MQNVNVVGCMRGRISGRKLIFGHDFLYFTVRVCHDLAVKYVFSFWKVRLMNEVHSIQ